MTWGERPKEVTWGTVGALQVQPPYGAMWDYRTNDISVEVDPKEDRLITVK